MREDLGVAREFISAFCAFAGSFFSLKYFFKIFFHLSAQIALLTAPPPRKVSYFRTIYHVETFFSPRYRGSYL